MRAATRAAVGVALLVHAGLNLFYIERRKADIGEESAEMGKLAQWSVEQEHCMRLEGDGKSVPKLEAALTCLNWAENRWAARR